MKAKLTKRDVELLEKIIAGLNLLIGLFSTNPTKQAKQLRNKFRNKRERERERFPHLLVISYYNNISYNKKSLKEFLHLIERFDKNPRFGSEYDKRRLRSLSPYIKSLLQENIGSNLG